MDIEYLLWLQNLRDVAGDFWPPLMEAFSYFTVRGLIVVPVFLYWSISRRAGLYILFSQGLSEFINGVLKITFCIYRPWIRDPRVKPFGNAIETATGYSFPSGHTMRAAPIWGGTAVVFKKYRWFVGLMILGILLTAFARNYLGVHTPQDVVVGTTLGLCVLYVMSKIFAYLEKNPDKENLFLISGLVIVAIALVYITYKPYPMDYVDGKLLVDPRSMMRDAYKNSGILAGMIIGRYLEKRFINFKPTGLKNFKGLIFVVIGLVIFIYLRKLPTGFLGKLWGRFASDFIRYFFVIFIWPVVLKIFCNDNSGR